MPRLVDCGVADDVPPMAWWIPTVVVAAVFFFAVRKQILDGRATRPESLSVGAGRRIATGLVIGFFGGGFLLGVGLLRAGVFVLRGGTLTDSGRDDLAMASMYVLGTTLAGGVGGFLDPIARRSRSHALAVGMILMQPFLGAIHLVESGMAWSGDEDAFVWAVMTAIFGPVIGLAVWRKDSRQS